MAFEQGYLLRWVYLWGCRVLVLHRLSEPSRGNIDQPRHGLE